MKSLLRMTLTAGSAAAIALAMVGCSANAAPKADTDASGSVRIETNNGSMDVKRKPARVAALDNSSMATLRAFGVEPVAIPKPILPRTGFEDWIGNKDIKDAGNHREPSLEAVSEAEPDLIIGGQRFASHTEKLKKIAPVVDVAPSTKDGASYLEGLKKQTLTLGEIFDKQDEAKKIVADLDASVAKAKDATHGESVFLANSNGGKIDNGAGRIGRILEGVNLKDVFAKDDQDLKSDSVHNNSGLAPETVAAAKPDWMIIMDRDSAIAKNGEEVKPAKAVIDGLGKVWAKTPFYAKDQIIYLPKDFYLTEGIQAYTTVFNSIADDFTAKTAK